MAMGRPYVLNKAHQQLIAHSTSMEGNSSVSQVPGCLQWTVEEVADWIEKLGYKEYRVHQTI